MKRWIKRAGVFLFIMIVVFVFSFIPTLWLKTSNMTKLQGNWIDVYYEKEKGAATDVFNLAEEKAEYLSEKLGFSKKQPVVIYIYDSQYTMQTKKYGMIVPLFGLDWYIGDNIGTNVILTSPANPGNAHNYDDNKYASLHEMVHAYISIINPRIKLWLTEGMALYLSNGAPFSSELLEHMKIPSFNDIKTSSPIHFANMGGYAFAHTYIEYLDKEYGWGKVLELIKTGDYNRVFGKTDEEIYHDWVGFLKDYGSG